MPKPRESARSLIERLDRTERKWLAADAVCHEAFQVLDAARDRTRDGRDGEASILVDAALRILWTYAERDTTE